ncbi:MAG: GspH/FimT family pseudopilin [Planctomycetota bacterium]|nr:GspH/FimT family pseudopilin [Planctomycetota bacterium]
MSIVAIASVVAVPQLAGSISRARVTGAAQRVMADLARTRTRAIAQSRSVTITFARLEYRITGDQRSTDRAMPALVSLAAAPYYTQIESVDFNGTDTITYDMFGTPSCGGSITIASGSHSVIIKVDEASGIGVIR